MTTLQLLAYISTALLLQIAIGIGLAVWRMRRTALAVPDIETVETPPVAAGAWPGLRAFRVARREFEDPAGTQCSFYLEPVDCAPLPPFRPGQFLTFSVPDAGSNRSLVRCYSLSDRPRPDSYRITIKRCLTPSSHPEWPTGIVSAYFHDRVQQGDNLQVRAPAGQFFLDPEPAIPAVLIGGGIGITPMLSMLHWCMADRALARFRRTTWAIFIEIADIALDQTKPVTAAIV